MLTHFDAGGNAHMVDVSEKPLTARIAVAQGTVRMSAETLALITEGRAAKGDVLAVARLAGIMAAKKTADLIPLCHPLPITKVALDLTPDAALPGVVVSEHRGAFASANFVFRRSRFGDLLQHSRRLDCGGSA